MLIAKLAELDKIKCILKLFVSAVDSVVLWL